MHVSHHFNLFKLLYSYNTVFLTLKRRVALNEMSYNGEKKHFIWASNSSILLKEEKQLESITEKGNRGDGELHFCSETRKTSITNKRKCERKRTNADSAN